MEIQINIVQFIGIWLMLAGLIVNTIVFIYAYNKIVLYLKKIKEDVEKEETKKKKWFPILRKIFQYRQIVKDAMVEEKRDNFEEIVVYLKWILIIAVGLIAVGVILFVVGFMF